MTQGSRRTHGWGLIIVIVLGVLLMGQASFVEAFIIIAPPGGPPGSGTPPPTPTPTQTPAPTPIPTPAPPAVLFIPGLQGSRLYTEGALAENKLWEPNRNADVAKLFMNESGESISPDIYTRDVIDEAFGYNIYKTFLGFLDDLVTANTITTWQAVPYDWRLAVEDHVAAVTAALEELQTQAPNSPITIIAHSNGGLIAKAVLQELEAQQVTTGNDLIDSIDRVILVATPQLGTPKAIASMLHGYDLDYVKGLVLSQATARRLAEYMPSAFTLLPSATYFDTVADPVIQFDDSVDGFLPLTSSFGPTIDNPAELQQFLTGNNSAWSKPVSADIITPNVLKTSFLNQAAQTQSELEQWQPPSHINLIQIAGWGLDTIKTIKYTAKRTAACHQTVSAFCRDGYKLDLRPVFTVDGDETVVTPSAVAMDGQDEYFLNLKDYNKELLGGRRNRKHSDLFEADPVQSLIGNLLGEDGTLPLHITTEQPIDDDVAKRLRLSVHSPVALSVSNETGDRTGIIENPDSSSDLVRVREDVPNSYYLEFGEGKYVGFDTDEPHTVTLIGTGIGTFDFNIEEVTGDTMTETLNYEDIPVLSGTVAELSLQTIDDAAPLKIDMDGNGIFETQINPGEQLSPVQLIDSLSVIIASLDLKKGGQKSIQNHLKNAKKKMDDTKHKNIKSVASHLKNVEKTITKATGKSITDDEASAVIDVLLILRVRLNI